MGCNLCGWIFLKGFDDFVSSSSPLESFFLTFGAIFLRVEAVGQKDLLRGVGVPWNGLKELRLVLLESRD